MSEVSSWVTGWMTSKLIVGEGSAVVGMGVDLVVLTVVLEYTEEDSTLGSVYCTVIAGLVGGIE